MKGKKLKKNSNLHVTVFFFFVLFCFMAVEFNNNKKQLDDRTRLIK